MDEVIGAAFNTMCFIVTVGWSIYPVGSFFGCLMGEADDNVFNSTHNLADMLNKFLLFCLLAVGVGWIVAWCASLSSFSRSLSGRAIAETSCFNSSCLACLPWDRGRFGQGPSSPPLVA